MTATFRPDCDVPHHNGFGRGVPVPVYFAHRYFGAQAERTVLKRSITETDTRPNFRRLNCKGKSDWKMSFWNNGNLS